MSIKGSIESIYLSSMLQMLCNDGKTGILRIWDAGNEVKIYLHDGNIIYATSSRKQHRLGFLLRSKGLISADGLRQCLQLSRIKNQALGKTLVEEGLISQEDLQKFMYRKVSYTLYHAFMWQKGNFEFAEVPLNLEESLMVRLNTIELILEASRRADERSIRNIKAPTEVPGTPEEEKTINLLPSDKE